MLFLGYLTISWNKKDGRSAFKLKTSGAPRTVGDPLIGPCNPDPIRAVWGSRLAQRIFPRFAPMSPGFDSRSRHLCAFGFQSKLASVGFPRVLRFSLLHLKLGFLDKSVSGVSWRRPLNLMPMHYWDLPGFSPNVININIKYKYKYKYFA